MVKLNKNQILVGIAVLAILVTGGLILAKQNNGSTGVLSYLNFNFLNPSQAVAQKTLKYINANMMPAGQSATLESVSEASGLVKMKIKVGTTSYDTYVTKDGKLLFPVAAVDTSVKTAAPAATNTTPTAQVTPANVAKVAKTSLEAYVVSSCPYGLQIQRAIGNAVKAVPALAESIKVRYIGAISGSTITAMHGPEEAAENLRQICIRDEQQSKYWDYVDCYMQKATGTAANGMPYGDTKTCQATAKIDTAKLNACVADPKRGLAYAKTDFDLGTKLGVTGSPTMVLNGQKVDETPFGGRTADSMRNMVCSSSTAPAGFCSKTLDTTPAATSFSLAYAGSATAAAANCAPVAQ